MAGWYGCYSGDPEIDYNRDKFGMTKEDWEEQYEMMREDIANSKDDEDEDDGDEEGDL